MKTDLNLLRSIREIDFPGRFEHLRSINRNDTERKSIKIEKSESRTRVNFVPKPKPFSQLLSQQ